MNLNKHSVKKKKIIINIIGVYGLEVIIQVYKN